MKRIAFAAAALLVAAGAATAVQTATAATAAPAPPGVTVSGLTYQPGAHLPKTHLPKTHPQRAALANGAFLSSNWSGYADVVCGTCALRYVAASYTLPSIDCARSPDGSAVSNWVGLDGLVQASTTVEQIGTLATCSAGTPSYFAFYEMFPNPAVGFTGINPGDAISANVFFNSATGHWQLTLTDVTTGGNISTAQTCPAGNRCLNSSAEVITEAPFSTTTNSIVPLSDFGQVNSEALQVTSRSGTRGSMISNGLWTTDSLTMVNNSNAILAAPGPVYGGQAFQDTWRAAS